MWKVYLAWYRKGTFLMLLVFTFFIFVSQSVTFLLNSCLLTKIPAESSEENQPVHRTGSARSEGFYKISRKDKIKYLIGAKPADLHPTGTQVLRGI